MNVIFHKFVNIPADFNNMSDQFGVLTFLCCRSPRHLVSPAIEFVRPEKTRCCSKQYFHDNNNYCDDCDDDDDDSDDRGLESLKFSFVLLSPLTIGRRAVQTNIILILTMTLLFFVKSNDSKIIVLLCNALLLFPMVTGWAGWCNN